MLEYFRHELALQLYKEKTLGLFLVAQTVKNLPAMQETHNPWVRRIPWRKEWLSTSVFLPGEFPGQRSLGDYSPCSCNESDKSEQLTFTYSPGTHLRCALTSP